MKKILFAALAAATVALPSCSNDEAVEVAKGDAIHFNVTAGNASRSNINTTANLTEFYLWANAANKDDAHFMEATVSKNGDDWNYGDTEYWPQTAAVDFFAVAPTSLHTKVTAPNSGKEFKVVNFENDGLVDFIYAGTYGEKKKQEAVVLNFRHALAQVVFQAKNSNPAFKVEISKVEIKNIQNKGTFTWASATTKDHLSTYLGSDDTETGNTWGTWELVADSKADFVNPWVNSDNTIVTLAAATKDEHGNVNAPTPVDLTIQDGTHSKGGILVMPQTVTPWNYTKDGLTAKQSYFAVTCRITNNKGVQLWPETADQLAPVAVAIPTPAASGEGPAPKTWKQGKRYTYVFDFNKGAGWNPDPNKPEPVLFPIDVTVTVDEFQDGGTTVIPGNDNYSSF